MYTYQTAGQGCIIVTDATTRTVARISNTRGTWTLRMESRIHDQAHTGVNVTQDIHNHAALDRIVTTTRGAP